ncbi:MAG: hypothetical protein ACFFAN_04765 [Promethearchaeota archaeon]
MGKILEDVKKSSIWIAKALKSSNYRTDFSPESLLEIERFFNNNTQNGKPILGGLLSKDLGNRIFAIGCYVGEVICKSLGGKWNGDDSDPQAEINVTLKLPDSSIIWPVQRVMKRFKNGPEDSIVAYGSSLGLRINIK